MKDTKYNIKNNTNVKAIEYSFKDTGLFETALTHSSYVNELIAKSRESVSLSDNERLEFLGDAALELVISEHIYSAYPELSEGEMTKLRASIVCEATISEAAKRLDLGSVMRVGRGEERTGGRDRGSILADCFEAVAGAVFLDGGFSEARTFIMNNLHDFIKIYRSNFKTSDYKTHLQEIIQRYSKDPVEYRVISETGPAHDKTFEVGLAHEGRILATAKGKSKKEAEQSCAKQALEKIGK